jgi:hypothetical protein
MEHAARSYTPAAEAPPLVDQAARWLRDLAWSYTGAMPIRLRRDVLYLWATFRLRYRPFKMLALILFLGLFCAVYQWAGIKYGEPRLLQIISAIRDVKLHRVLTFTSSAIFSSLNFLSCVGIVIMARSLRHLLKQGHIENLQLVPRRLRPSALFYAIATRYLPLAFVAILVIYLSPEPRVNPFTRFPFIVPGAQPAPPEMAPLYWAALHQLSILLFCPANLFMDLAIAFWLFNRFRVSWPTTIGAVLIIGLVSPILLMYINNEIQEYVITGLNNNTGIFNTWSNSIGTGPYRYISFSDISHVAHYTSTAFASVLLALLALGNLNFRWRRIEGSETKDPVLLKPLD